MRIDTTFLRKCIETLRNAVDYLPETSPGDRMYEICRAACVKHFELVLEQSGKLLRKRLRDWFASNREVDELTFADVFRHAAKHAVITAETAERWLEYRTLRNDTAHDYGENYAEATIGIVRGFLEDAEALADVIEDGGDE